MPITQVELKYCEGCGALRLRPTNAQSANHPANQHVYCSSCASLLAPRPARRGAAAKPEGGRQ